MPTAPTSPRPAQGFSTQRAQKWVLASALITALVYGIRRITGDTAAAPGLKNVAGIGQPTTLAHWAVSYGIAYTMLALLAVAAPEAAASLAMLTLLGNLLANGKGLASDLKSLESGGGYTPQIQARPPAAQVHAQAKNAPGLAKQLIPTPPAY